MKACQVKIELEHTDSVVWRRVITPASATLKECTMLYKILPILSGYPYDAYHLYEFYLEDDNIIVTNNEQVYEESIFFKKIRIF